MGKKKYGLIYDKSGKAIGVSGPVGPIGIQGVCSHPGPKGVAGPPGGGPPFVGQFRWCTKCNHSYFLPIKEEERWTKGQSKMNCPACGGSAVHIMDAWCPKDVILIWEEETVK